MGKKLLIIIPIIFVAGIISFRLTTHTASTPTTKVIINPENLHHLTMKIDGMYCASCPYNVENALKDTAGVVNVTVGFVGKEIINGTVEGRGEVIYDQTQVSPTQMIMAILPYKGTVLNDEKATSSKLTPLSKTFGL